MSNFRRLGVTLCAAGLALAASEAKALDAAAAFEPALTLHWSFGGARETGVDLDLRLNYSQDRFEALKGVPLPAFAQWTFNTAGGSDALLLNGLPLHAGKLYASEAEGQPAPAADSTSPGVRVGLILLGAGGATALIVGALGHAAQENNPAVSQNQGQVACNQNPVTSTCVIGNGG